MTNTRRTDFGSSTRQPRRAQSAPVAERLECLFYSESEAAARLGIHRTTLRALALAGHAPVEPITLTEHRRLYRRADIHRLAGLEP
ncbi:hypothetical protein ACPW96_20120 [Micromonospora sp. DT81.3]|uniref:hypothetical protein n=1 Tax=Micromonospora sp. DT81.3 TaxID=3416523 RepID=UPI003CEF567B